LIRDETNRRSRRKSTHSLQIMKKLLILAAAFAVGLASCKKGEEPAPSTPDGTNNNNNNNNGAVPATFTRKVLLETFVGAWCSTCPDADAKRDQAVTTTNNGRVVTVTAHQSDGMTIGLFSALYTSFSQYSPSGMVNRTPSLGNVLLSPAQWLSNVSVALGKTASCGLALASTISASSASVEVKAGFNTALAGDYRLVVYLVEDSVTGTGSGFDQMNAYNASPGSPFYNLGNPILNYRHNRVVRAVLTAATGDAIPASALAAGGLHKQTFSNVSLAGYDTANLHVVAFVTRHGATASTHEVMNVQTAEAGTVKNWD
jgi:hypothetical protein